MAVLNISTGDTAPKSFQVQQNGVARDLTGMTITCRIATDPVTTKTAVITAPETGNATIVWGGLPPGTYQAQFVMTTNGVDERSALFTIVVEAAI